MKTEQDIFRLLKKKLGGHWVRIEPFSGSTGCPDCIHTWTDPKTHKPSTLFIELKIFKSFENPLRPSQIAFLTEARKLCVPFAIVYYHPDKKQFIVHNSGIFNKYYLLKILPEDLFKNPIPLKNVMSIKNFFV